MEDTTRTSIVSYIELRADQHLAASTKATGADASYHKGTAVLFKALASDVKAGLDVR